MHSIYGLGGWNRYAVLNSGEITFIEFASISEDIKKAKEVGFRIFNKNFYKPFFSLVFICERKRLE